MRCVPPAFVLAFLTLDLSTQAADAGERLAFLRGLNRLPISVSPVALRYWECTETAAKETASRDNVSPATMMADWAASEAERQCASEGEALSAPALRPRQAAALTAMVRRANIQTALKARRNEPLMACAIAWRGCSMELPR
ncbi:MAG TPA: hypothetical protein VFY92_10185 [Hyphomicrobiaceae bacterium]|nr:hypothetical protein [Hyphomicrobiaceae bacterium]